MIQLHPTTNASQDCRAFVAGEVSVSSDAQKRQDLLQESAVVLRYLLRGTEDARFGLLILQDIRRDLRDRQDQIGQPSRDGAVRHPVEFGLFGILDNDEPTICLHILDPKTTVSASAGQNDCDCISIVRLGQSSKEMIDRRSFLPAILQLREPQVGIDRAEIRVGRDDIKMVRFQGRGFSDLFNRETNEGLQKFCKMTLVVRRQVHHDHEGQTAVVGNIAEEFFKGG
jgi:hypothetical protein